MKPTNPIARTLISGILGTICVVAFIGCKYEVPITPKPTGKIEEKLVGDWEGKDDKEDKDGKMKVRKLDDSTYVVSFDDHLYRAYHSDVASTPLISVQDLDGPKREYAYFNWKLSKDGKELELRLVRDEVVPYETKDSATVQKLLKQNLENPQLFEKWVPFVKVK